MDGPLALQILGDGTSGAQPRVYRAAAFSSGARAAIEAAGGVAEEEPRRPKWRRAVAAREKARAEVEAAAAGTKLQPRKSRLQKKWEGKLVRELEALEGETLS